VVCGTADSEETAFDQAFIHKPDIVLMDINLGSGSGLTAASKILDSLPKTRVIGLSLHDDITYVKKFLSLGAKGYLTKNTNKSELINAIHSVSRGELFIAAEIKDRYFASLLNVDESEKKELTMKDIEIVKLIAQGLTSKEIGDKSRVDCPKSVRNPKVKVVFGDGFDGLPVDESGGFEGRYRVGGLLGLLRIE
jgi:two-component system invasion response regulator UvrY